MLAAPSAPRREVCEDADACRAALYRRVRGKGVIKEREDSEAR